MKKRLTINLAPEAIGKLDFMADAAGQSDSHVVAVALDTLWGLIADSDGLTVSDSRIAGMMAATRAKVKETVDQEPGRPTKTKKG